MTVSTKTDVPGESGNNGGLKTNALSDEVKAALEIFGKDTGAV